MKLDMLRESLQELFLGEALIALEPYGFFAAEAAHLGGIGCRRSGRSSLQLARLGAEPAGRHHQSEPNDPGPWRVPYPGDEAGMLSSEASPHGVRIN